MVADTLRNKNGEAFADIMSVVHRTGGIDATREAAAAHQQQAIDALSILGDNDAVLALQTMASQAVERRG